MNDLLFKVAVFAFVAGFLSQFGRELEYEADRYEEE